MAALTEVEARETTDAAWGVAPAMADEAEHSDAGWQAPPVALSDISPLPNGDPPSVILWGESDA
jgi:hypothetical protein